MGPSIDALLQALKNRQTNLQPVGIVAKANGPVDLSKVASSVADSVDDTPDADQSDSGNDADRDQNTDPEQNQAIVDALQEQYPKIYDELKIQTASVDDDGGYSGGDDDSDSSDMGG
jgi:hypothetical protein